LAARIFREGLGRGFGRLCWSFGQKNRRISGIVFDVEIIGPLLSDSTIARTRNGRPEYKLAHDA
jgi:hypothetical protein